MAFLTQSANQGSSSTGTGNGLSGGAIGGIVGGVLGGLVVLFVMWKLWGAWKRRRDRYRTPLP
jgi:hypothetical protein